ncbi:cysteine proteinase inhibitor 5 [Mercurialis annua]|uniref:cysteine proteinase inhibitor 5 n=1 Tax=Mercurialis annua TaxID=3986 RepID=UPI0021608CB9|nr:cysteine proteinase inhibitor 5 [Mercurialis annua]
MKRHSIILCIVLSLMVAVSVSALGRGPMVGGWSKIKDLKDAHVVEIGKYAVAEYNRRSQTSLDFKSILKGEEQVVAGVNYKLVLAVDGGESKKYEAIVWEKSWEKFQNLTSFKPVN